MSFPFSKHQVLGKRFLQQLPHQVPCRPVSSIDGSAGPAPHQYQAGTTPHFSSLLHSSPAEHCSSQLPPRNLFIKAKSPTTTHPGVYFFTPRLLPPSSPVQNPIPLPQTSHPTQQSLPPSLMYHALELYLADYLPV